MSNPSSEMLAKSLDLSDNWCIKEYHFNSEKKEFHCYIENPDDVQFTCPCCGKTTIRYGFEKSERIWRHLDCFCFLTYIHCKRPRVRCPDCGVIQINAPFERKNSRFTLAFEGYAMLLLPDISILKASKALRCNEKSLTSILHYYVNQAEEERQLDDVTSIAIDETSRKRGHDYVTVVVDSKKTRD